MPTHPQWSGARQVGENEMDVSPEFFEFFPMNQSQTKRRRRRNKKYITANLPPSTPKHHQLCTPRRGSESLTGDCTALPILNAPSPSLEIDTSPDNKCLPQPDYTFSQNAERPLPNGNQFNGRLHGRLRREKIKQFRSCRNLKSDKILLTTFATLHPNWQIHPRDDDVEPVDIPRKPH